ncbi:MAG: FkbM family methyltransferase [Elusimicrobiota bacterium]|jgi:FkbM family methyltransferase|nr:FkbM family methyltransferase [Elusimicrobiota bacterium]
MKFQLAQDLIDIVRGKKIAVKKQKVSREGGNLEKSIAQVKEKIDKLAAKISIANNSQKLKDKFYDLDLKGIMHTASILSDEFSRETLSQVIKYRCLRDKKLLPQFENKDDMLAYYKSKSEDDVIKIWDWDLYLFNCEFLGYDIKVYRTITSLYIDFYLKQYEYHSIDTDMKVEEGDYIIDGGSCFGDTALGFAYNTGQKGKVYSFEFMPDSLEIWHKNIDLNPKLKERIVLVNKALYSDSNENLFVIKKKAGTRVEMKEPQEYDMRIGTMAIDDFVDTNKIPKIDFIKLDIEGAELECLKGAQKTIKQYKPKLAICLYHKDSDFITIPAYIKDLVPEYNLYIKHHTECDWETVLYAVCKNKGV